MTSTTNNQQPADPGLYQRIQKALADPGAPAVFNADWWVKRITELVEAETADLREKLERLHDSASELLEVAQLRGDNDYMSPEDDPLLWTSRRNEAWIDLEDTLSETAPIAADVAAQTGEAPRG